MGKLRQSKYLQSPWLESIVMVGAIILSYFGLSILSLVPQATAVNEMATGNIVLILLAFFLLSVAIAMVSVIAGIGGGVIFTPIMLAFTSVNSVVVRGTGLIVAMFSGLISAGIFIKKGLGNYRLCLVLTLAQGFGALGGATLAVALAEGAGAAGEGWMRAGLGLLLLLISVYFFLGGQKLEWPVIKRVGRFTRWMRLGGSYFEESEGRMRDYKVTRAPLGILLVFLVGIIGGFFGMGGGWAITPSLNMGMGIPLKLAAANSGIILGVGSCVSVWPYIFAGGVIPFFALPWLSGQVIGGFIGSYVLARIKVDVVRLILIGIMVFTSFGLITKGLELLGFIGSVPAMVQVVLFTAILACVILAVFMRKRGRSGQAGGAGQGGEATGGGAASAGAPAAKQPAYVDSAALRRRAEAAVPASNRIYASVVHWATIASALLALFVPIFILARPGANVLNPNLIFGAIFGGASPSDIWATSATGGFPGAHVYLSHPQSPDSWAMFAVNLGCSVGLWALIPAIFWQVVRERDWFSAVLGTVLAVLIALSMLGVLSV